MRDVNSRRLFLQKCFSSAFLLAFIPIMIESCASKKNETKKENETADSPDPCSDSEMSNDDIKKRESLGYVTKAPSENKNCGNCNLWLPPVADIPCGRCQLFKGPVPAEAHCTYWAPKV